MGLKVTRNHFGLIVISSAAQALLAVCMNKFDFDCIYWFFSVFIAACVFAWSEIVC